MARTTAAQWLDKWGRRLNAAGPDITSGVKSVQTAPGASAAAQKSLWLQKVTAAADLWAKQVGSVSLTDWQNAMINKGVGRIGAGVTAAQGTKSQVITNLLSAVDAASAAARSTPRGSLEQNIQRAVTFMQQMAANAPRRKS